MLSLGDRITTPDPKRTWKVVAFQGAYPFAVREDGPDFTSRVDRVVDSNGERWSVERRDDPLGTACISLRTVKVRVRDGAALLYAGREFQGGARVRVDLATLDGLLEKGVVVDPFNRRAVTVRVAREGFRFGGRTWLADEEIGDVERGAAERLASKDLVLIGGAS